MATFTIAVRDFEFLFVVVVTRIQNSVSPRVKFDIMGKLWVTKRKK